MSSRPAHKTGSHSARSRSTVSAPSSFYSALTGYYPPRSSKTKTTTRSASGSIYSTLSGNSWTGTSAYKRSPRPNFFVRVYEKIRRLIKNFIKYARKNPLKVLMPLIMALVSGGALTGLVKRLGGLEAIGLGSLGKIGLDRWIGAGQGVRTGYESWSTTEGMEGSWDGMGVVRGGLKIASAFL